MLGVDAIFLDEPVEKQPPPVYLAARLPMDRSRRLFNLGEVTPPAQAWLIDHLNRAVEQAQAAAARPDREPSDQGDRGPSVIG